MARTAALTEPEPERGVWYPMTWEEFLKWSPGEGQSEWVDGWGVVHPSQTTRHALMQMFSMSLLSTYLHVFDCGEMLTLRYLMRLPTIPSARSPDVLIVLPEHRDRITTWWLEGPADFVLEHVSEDSFDRDMVDKRAEYERAGVPEYVAVDARYDRDGFTFLRLAEDGRFQSVAPDDQGRYHSEVLPGLWFDPAWYRRDPLPSPEKVMFQIAPDEYWAYLKAIFAEHGHELDDLEPTPSSPATPPPAP